MKPENFRLAAILFGLTTLLATPADAANPAPVTVTNTTANPVPTRAQGVTPVSGTVSLSGTPSVQVTNTTPLLIRDVDRPTGQPYGNSVFMNFSDPSHPRVVVASFVAPAGKTLVIEHISVFAHVPPGQKVSAEVNGSATQNFVVMTSQGVVSDVGQELFVASQPIRLYILGSETVTLRLTRDSDVGLATGKISLLGYLVDSP